MARWAHRPPDDQSGMGRKQGRPGACSHMYRVIVHSEVNRAAWDTRVLALSGSIFHTTAWAHFRAQSGGTPLFLEWQAGDQSRSFAYTVALERAFSIRGTPIVARMIIHTPPVLCAPPPVLLHWGGALQRGVGVAKENLNSLDNPPPGAEPVTWPTNRCEFLLPPADDRE